jgi:hypothetical protein
MLSVLLLLLLLHCMVLPLQVGQQWMQAATALTPCASSQAALAHRCGLACLSVSTGASLQ